MTDPGWSQATEPPPLQQAIVDVHASYRSANTNHTPPDELVDDTVGWQQLKPHVVRSSMMLLATVVASTITFVFALCAGLSSVINDFERNSFSGSGGDEGNGGLFTGCAWLFGIIAVACLVTWIVMLFLPLREPIAEYSLLIEGRAAAYLTAYWWIWYSARERHTPFAVAPTRYAQQYLLAITGGRDQSLVVVRPYGADLYVGWTMWRSRSTVAIIWHTIRDRFRLFGGGTTFRSAVRGANTRALREVTHSVAREGVQVAIFNAQLPDQARVDLDAVPELQMEAGQTLPEVPIARRASRRHRSTVRPRRRRRHRRSNHTTRASRRPSRQHRHRLWPGSPHRSSAPKTAREGP